MTHALRHRGPDSGAVWIEDAGRVALGHRRLSILDLSPAGRQPMKSANGRYTVSFNGEIYNYLALKERLAQSGHQFTGSSDTEVLCAAFEEYGVIESLPHLNGMFAIVVWDARERLLHLACDRFGEKPLYFGLIDGWFAAASELKSLRLASKGRLDVDPEALGIYLRLGYVPAPKTIFQNVFKLAPASYVTFAVERAEICDRGTYWSSMQAAALSRERPFQGTEAEAVEALDSFLMASVKARLVADVPVGAFLSGGIDSTAIVAMMQHANNGQAKTFTIGMPDAGYDEAGDARTVAEFLGTQHTEHYVSSDEALSVLPTLSQLYDEPFADSSQIPTLLVSRLARQSVTVALSGDGGDELFGGYNRYVWAQRYWSIGQRVPAIVRTIVSRSLGLLGPSQWDSLGARLAPILPTALQLRQPGDKVQKIAAALRSDTPSALYASLVSHWDGELNLHELPFSSASGIGDPNEHYGGSDIAEAMMLLDLNTYLPGDILVKLDRAAMSVGLETRIPFLDPDLAAFCWSIPTKWKIRGNTGKWLLRRVLDRHVPSRLIDRPKSGFGVPLHSWLRGPLRDWASDLLDPGLMCRQGLLLPAPVQARWAQHQNGTRNWQHSLWTVLMLQSWLLDADVNQSAAAV